MNTADETSKTQAYQTLKMLNDAKWPTERKTMQDFLNNQMIR